MGAARRAAGPFLLARAIKRCGYGITTDNLASAVANQGLIVQGNMNMIELHVTSSAAHTLADSAAEVNAGYSAIASGRLNVALSARIPAARNGTISRNTSSTGRGSPSSASAIARSAFMLDMVKAALPSIK